MANELAPIIISCAIRAPLLSHMQIHFYCNNQSLVSAINKGSPQHSMVICLLTCLWFITASFDIHITATHLLGIQNNATNMLLRDQGKEFLFTHPEISQLPTTPSASPTKPSFSSNVWLDITIILLSLYKHINANPVVSQWRWTDS